MLFKLLKMIIDIYIPSLGFFTNSTPSFSNLSQALLTSGTSIPICPTIHKTFNLHIKNQLKITKIINDKDKSHDSPFLKIFYSILLDIMKTFFYTSSTDVDYFLGFLSLYFPMYFLLRQFQGSLQVTFIFVGIIFLELTKSGAVDRVIYFSTNL